MMCLKNQVTRFYEGSWGVLGTSSGLLVPIVGELFYDHYWRTDKTWKCSLFVAKLGTLQKPRFLSLAQQKLSF